MKEPADFKATYRALIEEERATAELEAFEREARDPEPIDFETAASWRALQPKLRLLDQAQTEDRRRFPTALVASLLISVLGLSAWIAFQQRSLNALRQPRGNAAIIDLFEESSRRSAGVPQVIVATDEGVTWILTPAAIPDFNAYELRILDENGALVRTIKGLNRHPDDTFTVFLPPSSLAAGDYRVELYGGGSDEPFATYRIRWVGASRF